MSAFEGWLAHEHRGLGRSAKDYETTLPVDYVAFKVLGWSGNGACVVVGPGSAKPGVAKHFA